MPIIPTASRDPVDEDEKKGEKALATATIAGV
jgi:hypothetical protein